MEQKIKRIFKIFFILIVIVIIFSFILHTYSHFLIDTLGLPRLESAGNYEEFEVIVSATLYTLGFTAISLLLVDLFRYIKQLFIKEK
jgi:hypothetical protein